MSASKRKRGRSAGRPAGASSGNDSGRERILAVALQLFARKGYDAISIRDIAAAAGITLSSLYHHFGDKRGLYVAVHRRAFEKSSARLEAAVERGATAAENLKSFTVELCRVLCEPEFFRLVSRHWIEGDPDVVRMLAQATVPVQYVRVRAALEKLGSRRRANALTLALYALVHGLIFQRPFADSLRQQRAVARDPAGLAHFVLMQLLPAVDWTKVPMPQRA